MSTDSATQRQLLNVDLSRSPAPLKHSAYNVRQLNSLSELDNRKKILYKPVIEVNRKNSSLMNGFTRGDEAYNSIEREQAASESTN